MNRVIQRDQQLVILYNKVSATAPEDMLDIPVQANWILDLLGNLGYKVRLLEFDPFRSDFLQNLRHEADLVFNLVDPSSEEPAVLELALSLLEKLGKRYTGSSLATLVATTDKVRCKIQLRHHGLPTPDWVTLDDSRQFRPGTQYILKPICEDASVGIEQSCVVQPQSCEQLQAWLRERSHGSQVEFFAEQFIDGPECHVMLLANGQDLEPLVPFRVIFEGFRQQGLAEIFSYQGKWGGNPAEYDAIHLAILEDSPSSEQLRQLALACAGLFDVQGYGKVDFRIDQAGQPYILEINANPSFYGFRPHERAGLLTMASVVQDIVESAFDKPWPVPGQLSVQPEWLVPAKATIQEIPYKGRGVIAVMPILAGDVIERCPIVRLTQDDLNQIKVTTVNQYYFEWEHEGALVLGFGSLYNHAYRPNARYEQDQASQTMIFYALRDIMPGEEITINYNFYLSDQSPLAFDVH